MTRKIISFLGDTGNLEFTHYVLPFAPADETKETKYIIQALHKAYPDASLYLFVTPKARESHETKLNDMFAEARANQSFKFVPVPDLKEPGHLWTTFKKLQEIVQDGDKLIFDITHSYRSLPLLALLAIAFLRVVREVTLEALLYAPFECYEHSQVYDLKPFVVLLDWTTATHLFLKTGNADELTALMKSTSGIAWSEEELDINLEYATSALRLARPDEGRRLVRNVVEALDDIDLAINRNPQVAPFSLLANRIRDSLTAITPEEIKEGCLRQELQQELALIRWNAERGQWMSAVAVAREWLVSLACYLAGWTEEVTEKGKKVYQWQSRKMRDRGAKAEKVLKGLKLLYEKSEEERNKVVGQQTPKAQEIYRQNQPLALLLGQTWDNISTLRNDLLHAGKIHSSEPEMIEALDKRVRQVPTLLTTLARAAKLFDEGMV